MPTPTLDNFTRAYIEAALFSSTDDEGFPLDKYDVEDFAPATLEAMVKDCKQFQQENAEAIDENGNTHAGHDFWLTRCGHGSGFWDGDWPVNGRVLTLAAKKYGEVDLYVGDDGYIYQMGTETSGPVPPREEFNPTPKDIADMKAMGIRASHSGSKVAVYVEEQWEDILQKKGYVEDESTQSAWEDTLYVNHQYPDIQVLIHESSDPYYLVELNGEMIEQGTDPEKLWDVLEKAPELYRKTINHPRELNENDMKEMGILPNVKSGLLRKKEPKMAFEFKQQPQRQYDYEASGQDVVLISPANTTKLLEADDARNFYLGLDRIEDLTAEGAAQEEYDQQVQTLIGSYFDKDLKSASVKYVVKVDASGLRKDASTAYIAGVVIAASGSVEKLKFTTKKEKAATFTQEGATQLKEQLVEFRLGGSVVRGLVL